MSSHGKRFWRGAEALAVTVMVVIALILLYVTVMALYHEAAAGFPVTTAWWGRNAGLVIFLTILGMAAVIASYGIGFAADLVGSEGDD